MTNLEKQLATIRRLIHNISTQEKVTEDCLKIGATDSANESAFELACLCESLTLRARELPCEYGRPMFYAANKEFVRNPFHCEIGYTPEGWFRLVIPMLLPKKSPRRNVEYIRDSLYPPMVDFFRNHPGERLDDCVIVFRHVYDRTTPEKQYRDHDNIEVKQVTDIVAFFTMKDDGPGVCSHYYCTAAGETNFTQVYVVPRCEFELWRTKYDIK